MTSHKYYKRGLVTAEQFDEGWWQSKYHACKHVEEWEAVARPLSIDRYHGQFVIVTLEGDLRLNDGDWIATGVNGEHWPIADDIFHKTYAELPVIPQAVAYAIEWFQQNDDTIGEIWRNLYEDVDDDWKQVPNLREPEEWMLDHQDTFTMAWSLGEWEVENG
ncbi:alpha-galactosidase [Lacticaseibacillus sp. 866-1]|uniref:alpha-galactosidase n=1 Tax=Lacticaseibacillus sp. 866-1 TaxID=2799576 RepID=UPI001EF2B6BB|nr:alpha-galactosidase [Lacticaseibacillus sp. 866-1]